MDKESLGLSLKENLNTLVLTIVEQINNTDFIDESLGINDDFSQEILLRCIEIGYLTQE